MSESVLLSSYITRKSKGKSLHPQKLDTYIQQELMDPKHPMFGQVLPIKNYYGLDGDKVSNYPNRTEATEAVKKNSNMKHYRDYLIFDPEGFEALLDDPEIHKSIYNQRSGRSSSPTPFKEADEASSYSLEDRKNLLEQMKRTKLERPKREVSPEQLAKMQAGRKSKASTQEDTKSNSKGKK